MHRNLHPPGYFSEHQGTRVLLPAERQYCEERYTMPTERLSTASSQPLVAEFKQTELFTNPSIAPGYVNGRRGIMQSSPPVALMCLNSASSSLFDQFIHPLTDRNERISNLFIFIRPCHSLPSQENMSPGRNDGCPYLPSNCSTVHLQITYLFVSNTLPFKRTTCNRTFSLNLLHLVRSP